MDFIPDVPTENLHKFMALLGIAMAVACFFYFASASDELKIEVIQAATEMNVLKSEEEALKRSIDLDDIHLETLKEFKNVVYGRSTILAQADKKVDEVKLLAQVEDRMTKSLAVEEKILTLIAARNAKKAAKNERKERVLGKGELIRYHHERLQLLRWSSFVTILLGAFISYFGFRRWAKIQNYLDEISRKQAQDVSKSPI